MTQNMKAAFFSAVTVLAAFAAYPTEVLYADSVKAYCEKNEKQILTDFIALLSIPNEASDTANIRRNVDWIVEKMRNAGLDPKLLHAKDPAAPPAIFGEWKTPGAKRTLVFYAHYDGQPADPEEWTITAPWKPVFRLPAAAQNTELAQLAYPTAPDTRIYGRSTSDDKAGVMAILAAFQAIRAIPMTATSNLKFIFEGEEEAGSPHLNEITAANKDLLKADAWILVDGPVHPTGRKQVVFGVRGDENVDITIYGPVRPLHSGHYGNWAPNPAMKLAKLLASMKDDTGRVLIESWYDDVTPLTDLEIQAIHDAPAADEELKSELGIAQPDGAGKSLMELIMLPSLNINGMRGGDVLDRARNVIPVNASATLDLRLVKGNDYRRQYEKLVTHIRKQGYLVLDREPTLEERRKTANIARVVAVPGAYNAQRTPMDLPISAFVIRAVQSVSDQPVVKLPSLGGSLPLSIVEQNLECPLITVPLANHDNNQHGENENLRLGNFWSGIETLAALFTAP